MIDKVSGVITKTSGAQRNDKYSLYEQVLNAGDALLNGEYGFVGRYAFVLIRGTCRCREVEQSGWIDGLGIVN